MPLRLETDIQIREKATASAWDQDTDSLEAIRTKLDSVYSKVDYSEGAASGTTVNAYADALDLDTRGAKSLAMVIANTDGANALKWKALRRYASYAAGVDEEDEAEVTLNAGEKSLYQRVGAGSRTKIQVKSSLAGTPATYTVYFMYNK
jgi:hypothetical protein